MKILLTCKSQPDCLIILRIVKTSHVRKQNILCESQARKTDKSQEKIVKGAHIGVISQGNKLKRAEVW